MNIELNITKHRRSETMTLTIKKNISKNFEVGMNTCKLTEEGLLIPFKNKEEEK